MIRIVLVVILISRSVMLCPIIESLRGDWHFAGTNVALRKPATQLPGAYESYTAGSAVDGNCNNDLVKGPCTHTVSNMNGDLSWSVDLGALYYVTGIVIYNRKKEFDRLEHFNVYGIGDHGNSEVIYDDDTMGHRQFNHQIIKFTVDGRNSFSIINVTLPAYSVHQKESYLSLCEVQIYAAPPRCPSPSTEAVHGILKISNNTGMLVSNNFTVGSLLFIECSRNYFLRENSSIICQGNGQYNGTIQCTPGCVTPTKVDNGIIQDNRTWIEINHYLQFNCNIGFNKSAPIQCCQNGEYCNKPPFCKEVFCPVPEIPQNGGYTEIIDNKSRNGTVIVEKCNVGYTINTINKTRTCQINGQWSGHVHTCQLVTCSKLNNSQNAYYIYNENTTTYDGKTEVYNTVLLGKCRKGYNLSVKSEIRCNETGNWIGNVPNCTIVKCPSPEKFPRGYYQTDNQSSNLTSVFNYKTRLNVICQRGFKLKSKSSVRICEESTSWSGDPPICELVKCPRPENLDGGYYTPSINSSSLEGLPYNTTLTVTCNDGFTLDNNLPSRTCNESGEWSYLQAKCKKESSFTIIVGVSSSVVVVCVAIIAAIVIIRRKRRGNKKRENKYTDTTEKNNSTVNEGEYSEIQETRFDKPAISKRKSDNRGAYENVQSELQDCKQNEESSPRPDEASNAYYNLQSCEGIPKFAIKIENLSDLILKGDAAKNRFEKEFEKLPEGMVREHKDAVKKENIGKNRYKNLYAYDHCRVVLRKEKDDQSDYINACYVNGYDKAQAYIASQGPTKEILNDFWRMIWQTDCGKIVMLTNLTEENKSKCTQYWPNNGEVVYDEITVGIQKSESFSEFVIRTFIVKKHSKARHVSQFHFTAWPDKGVPKYASSIVQFRNKVKYASTHRHGPILVHCSAGVGRTGTFIALDYLTEQANDVGYVDVFGSVEEMRKQRVNLVQTPDQYIFIHHALVETLMLATSALPSNKFPQWYESMLQIDHRAHKRKLDLEFETLSKLSPNVEEAQYFSAKQIRNRKKNRYSNILPVDDFMPQLEPLDGTHGDTTYINAVFLQSYREKNAFIITQTPLEGTIDDFWRLVWEHDIHIIVMMNNIHEASKAEQYWPDDGSVFTSRNIKIEHTKTEELKYHKVLTFSLQKHVISRKIVQVQCGGWQPNHNLPDSKDVILSLSDTVQSLQRKMIGNQSVLVHCMNGADKSGLFCVIYAVIERMKIEQDVAITQVIEEMRNAREQIIPTVQQYQFCHEAVLAYIEEFSTYSNFSLQTDD